MKAIRNLNRLKPEDSDAPVGKPYSGDYAGGGDLDCLLFSALGDRGSSDDPWPNTDTGNNNRRTAAFELQSVCITWPTL